MSEDVNILEHGYGMPRIWLFASNGAVLVDGVGRHISQYVTAFEYTYDEEEDDSAKIDFEFPDVNLLDLPYLKQDIVIKVQWGYILPGGKVLKSPVRTVAIRDIKNSYDIKGIKLTLECTDLVAYIKNLNVTTTARYSRQGIEAGLDLQNRLADHFLDYIDEIAGDEIVFTAIVDNVVRRRDLSGDIQHFEYDEKTNTIGKAVDNARARRIFFNEFKTQKKTLGNSAALYNAIEDKMKFLTDKARGAFLANATDNQLMIHARNFNQEPFKTFTWAGGNGELIVFKPSTNTRKVKENTSSSNVNPYTKAVEEINVNALDTKEIKNLWDIVDEERKANDLLEANSEKKPTTKSVQPSWKMNQGFFISGTLSKDEDVSDGKYSKRLSLSSPNAGGGLGGGGGGGWGSTEEDMIDTPQLNHKGWTTPALEEYADKIFQHYLNDIDKQEGPNTTPDFFFIKRNFYNQHRFNTLYPENFNIAEEMAFKFMNMNANQVLNSIPEFRDILDQKTNEFRDQSKEIASELKAKNLVGYVTEKIVRKYEANATIVGDPSMIKSRTYLFLGLSRVDSGSWYATTVKHKIDFKGGYVTEFKLIKKPEPIGLSKNVYEAKTLLDKEKDETSTKAILYQEQSLMHIQEEIMVEGEQSNSADFNIEHATRKRDVSIIEGMENRLDVLYKQDQLFNEQGTKNQRVKVNKTKPNADKF